MEKKDIARVLKAKRSETGLSVKDVIDLLNKMPYQPTIMINDFCL